MNNAVLFVHNLASAPREISITVEVAKEMDTCPPMAVLSWPPAASTTY